MEFRLLEAKDLPQFKADMQEAFQLGAVEGGYPANDEQILPESHIDASLQKPNAVAYKAVLEGEMVGGAIVALNPETHTGYLDFLYVKHGIQGKGIGRFLWFAIEKQHPEITVWETCTPYFEKRNIHFYINICHFHAVEYFCAYHKDPHEPEEAYEGEEDFGMFSFRKEILP